jgi:hypothetical protein
LPSASRARSAGTNTSAASRSSSNAWVSLGRGAASRGLTAVGSSAPVPARRRGDLSTVDGNFLYLDQWAQGYDHIAPATRAEPRSSRCRNGWHRWIRCREPRGNPAGMSGLRACATRRVPVGPDTTAEPDPWPSAAARTT